MKKIVTLFSFFLLITPIFVVHGASTITIKDAPKLEQAYDDSLSVYWDKQPGALGYYIYYSRTPSEGKTYESLIPEFISGTGGTIVGLAPETKYYVAIVAVDENGEESAYSPEANFTTAKAGTSPKLAVKQVKLVSDKSIKLIFNVGLDTNSQAMRDFKVVDQTHGGLEKDIKNTELDATDSRVVYVDFNGLLEVNTKYVVTVIALQDKNGKSIESGVDGMISFVTPASFTVDNIENQNVSVNTNTLPDLNSGDPEAEQNNTSMTSTATTLGTSSGAELQSQSNQDSGMKGQNIQLNEMKRTVTSNVAQNSSKLPQTGPEHIILLLISLLVGAGVFIYTKKRQAQI